MEDRRIKGEKRTKGVGMLFLFKEILLEASIRRFKLNFIGQNSAIYQHSVEKE